MYEGRGAEVQTGLILAARISFGSRRNSCRGFFIVSFSLLFSLLVLVKLLMHTDKPQMWLRLNRPLFEHTESVVKKNSLTLRFLVRVVKRKKSFLFCTRQFLIKFVYKMRIKEIICLSTHFSLWILFFCYWLYVSTSQLLLHILI